MIGLSLERLHLFGLRVFRRLPVRSRRAVVRTVAPSYTLGAIALIERDDGRVLLCRQSYRNQWGLPGGLAGRGESPEETVVREVREEVGLDVDLVGEGVVVLDLIPQRIDIVYRARPIGGDVPEHIVPTSPEVTAAEWFCHDGLPDIQRETIAALDALESRPGGPHIVDRR